MLSDVVESETAARRVQVRVLAGFAAISFLLAGIGIHGLLAFAVSSRIREIGLRMALGARSGEIVAMVMRRGALLAAVGVVVGVGARLRRGSSAAIGAGRRQPRRSGGVRRRGVARSS